MELSAIIAASAAVGALGTIVVLLILRLTKLQGREADSQVEAKNDQQLLPASGMYADRTLAATGSGIILAGSILSLVVSQTADSPYPHAFVAEAVFLILISLLSAFFVFLRLFKAIWLVVWLFIAVFAICFMTTLEGSLDVQSVPSGGVLSFVQAKLSESVFLLFRYHVGWWVIFVGLSLLIWVAWNVRGRLFEVIPRSGTNISVFSPRTSAIINEIIEAPKWPLAAGAFLIMSGIIVLIAGEDLTLAQKLSGTVVTELGFAFFIAFVILLTIEIKSHAERDRQISKGILSYVYGINLDKELFLTTEEYIFKTPFYRYGLELEYMFIRRSGDKLLLKYTVSYVVKNVGRHPNNYPIHTFVEKSEAGGETSEAFPDVKLGLQRIVIDGVQVSDKEIRKARDSVPDSNDYMKSSHVVSIPAGDSKRVLGVHLMEKWVRDTELWQSVTPSAGVNLAVAWPEELNMEMHAGAVHGANNALHPLNGFDSKSYDQNSLRASLGQPLFPFNGVNLWWVCETEGEESSAILRRVPRERLSGPTLLQRLFRGRRRRK